MSKRDQATVISTDVLVIGGGLSGLVAAIKARESGVDVLVVERATVGWAGQATKAGNGLWVVGPEDSVDEFLEYHVRNLGEYLNDQTLMYSYAKDSFNAIEQLWQWGVQVTRNKEGKLGTFKHPVAPWSQVGVELDIMEVLRKTALKAGVKTINKVHIAELLKEGDRVVGAVGFGLIDMAFHVFRAKATIMATAGGNYRCAWFNSYGDGIAAAYRAGTEMRNAEFANMFDVVDKNTGLPLYGAHHLVYNALGQNISDRYDPKAPDVSVRLAMGMEKEVLEGRGPFYVDSTQMDHIRAVIGGEGKKPGIVNGMVRLFPKKLGWNGRLMAKGMKYGPPFNPKPEVTLEFISECSPIRVNHEMKTTVVGLWATGSASWNGSAWQGALPPPGNIRGTGLMTALLSGLRAGPSAAEHASGTDAVNTADGDVNRLRKAVFAPIGRTGGVSPADAMEGIISLMTKAKYSYRRSKDRLEEALRKVDEIRGALSNLTAKDGHGLGKCYEAKGLALCAELTFRSALARTESRGSHFREDYPLRDDKNWLKWIILKDQGGEMAVSTDPVPIERYKVKPPDTP